MALYVASHYKNTPNDLQLMSDAPAHHLFVLLGELLQDHLHVPFVCEVVVVIRLFNIWTWEVLLRFLPLDIIVDHIYGFFFNRSSGWDTKCTTWHSLCSSGMSPLSNLTFIRGHTWNWIEALCRLKALMFITCWCTWHPKLIVNILLSWCQHAGTDSDLCICYAGKGVFGRWDLKAVCNEELEWRKPTKWGSDSLDSIPAVPRCWVSEPFRCSYCAHCCAS